MSNITINSLPTASTIDGVNDYLPIYTNTGAATQGINRNTLLNLASGPVGLTDSQVLTNKTLTSPTINGATLSGTLAGTYTIGGTPTFPATVVQTTASQTLTNKTLTSPTINSPTITNATISADTLTGYTTSNSGTIYGIPVTTGTMSASYLTASTITNTQIASAGLYTTKVYNPYKFSVYRATNQTISSNTWTKVALDTKTFDTGTNFDTSANQFTAPIAGFYFLNGAVTISNLLSGHTIACGINVGTFGIAPTNQGGTIVNGAGTIGAQMVTTAFVQLAAGQTVQLYVYSFDTTVQGGSSTTCLQGFLVSAT